MKRMTVVSIAAPAALLLIAAAPSVFSDDRDKKTDVTFDRPVQVPGAVLQPGTYMFILMNANPDRNIVEIKSEDGKILYATTFATRAHRIERTGKVVLTFYEMPAGTPDAIRQWYWPGDYDGQEFLYAHQKALEIGAVTHQTVPEISDQDAAKLNARANAVPNQGNAPDQNVAAAPAPQAATTDDSSQQSQQTAQASVDQSAQQAVDQPAQQPVQELAQLNDQPVADSQSNTTIAQNYAPAYAPAPAAVAAADTSDNSANNNGNGGDPALPQTATNLPLVGLAGLISLAGGLSLKLAGRV